MRSRAKRWWSVAAAIGAAAIVVATIVVAVPLSHILTAYKAKMLCSEVFVGDRDPDAVLADLRVDDLQVLRLIDAGVDRQARTTMARLGFGMIEQQARFRADGGCAIVSGSGETPASTRRSTAPPADLDARPDRRLDDQLDAAFAEPDAARPRRTRAIVVVEHGRIVAERYDGVKRDTPLLGWSMTKSVLHAMVGILVKEGRLLLHGAAPVPAWKSEDDGRRRITLDHLLRMSSGLRFDEVMANPVNDVTHMLFRAPDMAAFAADRPLEAEPGTRWQYSSGTSLIVARIAREVLGDEAYRRFPQEALFDPLGMASAVLETDASGTFVASSFMYATARDWARFGMLYAQDGVWNGERLLPDGWVEYARTPAPADAQRAYGAHFWLRIAEGYNQSRASLPADTFHAIGHEGQFVTIVPSRGVVIVRLGKSRYAGTWDHGAFVSGVLETLAQAPPEPAGSSAF